MVESEQGLKSHRKLIPSEADAWRKIVIALTWTSIVVNIGLASVGFCKPKIKCFFYKNNNKKNFVILLDIAAAEDSPGEFGFAVSTRLLFQRILFNFNNVCVQSTTLAQVILTSDKGTLLHSL